MFVVINGEVYTTITNLSFAPEIDILSQSLPINEFYVDIQTTDDIKVSQYAALYDDLQNLWAVYWIVAADRLTDEVVTVHAQSILARFDKRMREAKMFIAASVPTILANITSSPNVYLHPSFENVLVTGYFPRQTARERLQMLCFTIGAIVKTSFHVEEQIEIVPIDTTRVIIPVDKTFWRPSITYTDYISTITVTAFTYEQRDPLGGEEYVEAEGLNYVVTRHEHILANPNIPDGITATDEIHIDDVYSINPSRADNLISHLGMIYFRNEELDAEVINNAEYKPAQYASVAVDPPDEDTGRIMTGFIDSCDFSFGVQAKSKIHMVVLEKMATTKLIVNYMYDTIKLGMNQYNYPVGYQYAIENPYIDLVSGSERYVYFPSQHDYATGTMEAGTNVNNQKYAIALHFFGSTGILQIISVTGVAWMDEDEEVITIE